MQFAVRHQQISTFRASFGDLNARLTADDNTIALEGQARVESVSITEPTEFHDHVVRGGDLFDADTHPLIAFRSTRIELDDDGTASVSGDLTIRARPARSQCRGRTSRRGKTRSATTAQASSYERPLTAGAGR